MTQGPRGRRRARAARAVLAAVAAALALAALERHRDWTAAERRLAATIAELGDAGAREHGGLPATLAADAGREGDRARGRIVVARAALAAELDPRRLEGLAPGELDAEREASARRLARVADLAAAALAERPAAWDAAMILGAATYLGWSQGRDPRLFTAHRAWEAPLEAALALAPGKRDAARFLTAAYLEVWPALSVAKRRRAEALLAAAFRDRDTLRLLAGAWLEVAPDRRAALAPVPDEPDAWEHLADLYARRRDWEGLEEVSARRSRALGRRLAADLAAAEERLANGDPAGARGLFLGVAGRAEPGLAHADLLRRAIELCPPGPVDAGTATLLGRHLDWVLDRCAVADCPLPPRALGRLARLCRDLPPEREALAALAAGDAERAERLERRAESQWSEAWAPYLVAKARWLAGRGRTDEAATALARVHRAWQGRPSFRLARVEVARAAGDAAGEATAEGELERLVAEAWPATAWTWRRGRARLEVLDRRRCPRPRDRGRRGAGGRSAPAALGGRLARRLSGGGAGHHGDLCRAVAARPPLPRRRGPRRQHGHARGGPAHRYRHRRRAWGGAGRRRPAAGRCALRPRRPRARRAPGRWRGSPDRSRPPRGRRRRRARRAPPGPPPGPPSARPPRAPATAAAPAPAAPAAASAAARRPPVASSSSGSLWAWRQVPARSAGWTSGKASRKAPMPAPVSGKRCQSSTVAAYAWRRAAQLRS